ncbi:MAG: hypothetical protein HY084_09165 [Gemmatimonadetes bacterium]|nr:hypothetical protein [Gemmatimonadota bacterium]
MTTIVAGGALASLVAADALASQGRRVVLLTEGPHAGGHFAGLYADGVPFDRGLVALELGADGARHDSDLASYDPDLRSDCARFGDLVRRWVERDLRLPLTRIPAVELWHDGTVVPDFLFDTNVHGLAALPGPVRERIAADLVSLPADRESMLHASEKQDGGLWDTLDIEVASLANHGRTLHERFIAPMLRKLVGLHGAPRCLARHSRVVAAPMYWPETVRRGLQGDRTAMAATPLHVVARGATSELVARLRQRLETSPLVSWRDGTITRVAPSVSGVAVTMDGVIIEGHELVWGGELAAFCRVAGQSEPEPLDRERLDVACVTIDRLSCRRPETGTLMIPAGVSLPFRLVNQSVNAGEENGRMRLTLEYTAGVLPSEGDLAASKVADALLTLGMVADPSSVRLHHVARLAHGFTVPSFVNQARALVARGDARDAGVPVRMVGPAAGFNVNSLGDQVVQGLQAAALCADATSAVAA